MMKFTTGFTLLSIALLSNNVLAASTRLVVSAEVSPGEIQYVSSQVQTLPETCFTLASGNNWCVPVLTQQAGQYDLQRSSDQRLKPTLRSRVVHVPAELTLEDAEYLLKSSGLYRYVERDIQVHSSDTSWNETTPDDTDFNDQHFFKDNSAGNPTASSVLSLWRQLKAPERNIDVYVLDGGFRKHEDISYADGFNFTVVSYDIERRPGFLEAEFNEECGSSHGVGVASVIGAKINNANGIAGIAGDVTIHPLRVLDCRTGFTTDIAAALGWLAGDADWLRQQSPDLPEFNGKPGIVNMSLGGITTECPVFLQNAVNSAIAKGFVLVAAAGNEASDVATSTPANCKGVISVGAANANQYTPADLAGFSNYGATLDIMAQGMSVPGLAKDEKVSSWNGTSFASPIVAGLLAAVQKDFDFSPAQWQLLVAISGEHRWVENSNCEVLGCGAGILDGVKLYKNAERMQKGELNSASYSLNTLSACRQQWAVDNLLPGKTLCDQVNIVMDGFATMNEREVIKLYAAEKGSVINLNKSVHQQSNTLTWLGDFAKTRFTMDKAELINSDIYAQVCDIDTDRCQLMMRVSTQALADLPAVCKE